MNVDQLVRHLATCRKRIKALRDDNQRLWDSRQHWKEQHAARGRENTALRKQLRWMTQSRDRWRARAPKRWTRPTVPPIQLRSGDLERILEMPPRP